MSIKFNARTIKSIKIEAIEIMILKKLSFINFSNSANRMLEALIDSSFLLALLFDSLRGNMSLISKNLEYFL